MCGIAAIWQPYKSHAVSEIASKMGAALRHRGPDACGQWFDQHCGIAISHQRLAILDLSPAGNQPMLSHDARWVIAFNGEIYNHLALRKELESGREYGVWRGHSDTETLLAAISAWGVEKTLPRITGMFAIAVWDRAKKQLWLVRDRFGEKPLYYGWRNGGFALASELKAFRQIPGWTQTISAESLKEYLRFGYVPTPNTIFDDVHKLPPGTWLRVDESHASGQAMPTPVPYWRAADLPVKENAIAPNDKQTIHALNDLLGTVIGDQMVADAPLGAFLSGGIDSSTVVALMQRNSMQAIKTFAIGFEEASCNEAIYAGNVARHLGTDHEELYISSSDALSIVPTLPNIYDEPFADVSAIPTFLVSRMASQKVKVVLSGDGGDELFGGYNRHVRGHTLWRHVFSIPHPVRKPLARAILGFCATTPAEAASLASSNRARFAGKAANLAHLLDLDSESALYRRMVSQCNDPNGLLVRKTAGERAFWADGEFALAAPETLMQRLMLRDQLAYLPDDILTKVDRASMATSLEVRVPFLDHRIADFAWRLPEKMRIRQGCGKWILRQLLYQYVPKDIVDRPKQGFSVPIDNWLRGPLREWAEDLIGESRLQDGGIFDAGQIRKVWNEHLSGLHNHQYQLWNLLMFQAWQERSQS